MSFTPCRSVKLRLRCDNWSSSSSSPVNLPLVTCFFRLSGPCASVQSLQSNNNSNPGGWKPLRVQWHLCTLQSSRLSLSLKYSNGLKIAFVSGEVVGFSFCCSLLEQVVVVFAPSPPSGPLFSHHHPWRTGEETCPGCSRCQHRGLYPARKKKEFTQQLDKMNCEGFE